MTDSETRRVICPEASKDFERRLVEEVEEAVVAGDGGVVSDFCTLDFFAAGALLAERCLFFVGIVKPRYQDERIFVPGIPRQTTSSCEGC